MFRNLRRKSQPEIVPIDPNQLSRDWLARDSSTPISLRQINNLPENAIRRVYRNLIPPSLLGRFNINPITWKGQSGVEHVRLLTEPSSGLVHIYAYKKTATDNEFFRLELADNAFNGIEIHMLLLNDPDSPIFRTDIDDQGHPTLFGTARRNLVEEERAKNAGLAPAQIRSSLGASRLFLNQLETFVGALGQEAFFMEPLTYASAWIFERRGCAYVRGHKLMDDIHLEFQPGGSLYQALTGDSPFRQPDQWNSVRGRAWAIHDGILEVIDAKWDNLRMIKQVGKHAGVETFPDAIY